MKKKLILKIETLQNLSAADLTHVRGGEIPQGTTIGRNTGCATESSPPLPGPTFLSLCQTC